MLREALVRQFDGNRDTYDSPVFEVGVGYRPFSGSNISLAAGRRIYPSGYVSNQDFWGHIRCGPVSAAFI